MKEIENTAGKLYYSIGEVARLFDVRPSLIRFWEKEFDIIRPQRNKKGNRMFTARDVDHFRMIYHLVKERGYTLQGAKDKLFFNPAEVSADSELAESLQKIRTFLSDLKKALDSQ